MFIIDGLVWVLFDWMPSWRFNVTAVVLLGLALLFLGWRVSLAWFPEKRCHVCKGNGSWGPGLLRRECRHCRGKGRVPRVGSGR